MGFGKGIVDYQASWSTLHSPSPQLCGECKILAHYLACLPLPQFLPEVGLGLSHRIRPVDLLSSDIVLDSPAVSTSQTYSKVGESGLLSKEGVLRPTHQNCA